MDYHFKMMTRNLMRKITPNLAYTICMYMPHVYVYVYIYTKIYIDIQGFWSGTSSKEPACQYRRHKRYSFDPWAGQIPWRREWQPAPGFLPGEPHLADGVASSCIPSSPWGCKDSDTTEGLTTTKQTFIDSFCAPNSNPEAWIHFTG